MHRRLLVVTIVVFLTTPRLHASCGSSSCPLDTSALFLPFARGFTLDLSLQYLDQDQPRIGTRAARIGEISGPHHDEVRTMNRIATALLTYAPTPRLHLSAAIPFVSRDHDHLASSHAHGRGLLPQHNTIPEAWHLEGVGDVMLQARANVASHLWLIGGVKLPTGEHELRNPDGEIAELPVQPGSGTTDGIVGVSYQRSWFFTATYQFRTGDSDGYRLGNELQLNAGSVHTFTPRLDLLLQLNARIRAKDAIEDEPEEEAFTGGTFVYASPGLRFSLHRASVYAIVQFPLRQDVKALQLTSDRNYVVGLQTRF